jgi:hypothetical protein
MSARIHPRHRATCSICEGPHYKRTCPIPQVNDEAPEQAKPMPHGPLSRCANNCGALLWARDKPTHECAPTSAAEFILRTFNPMQP